MDTDDSSPELDRDGAAAVVEREYDGVDLDDLRETLERRLGDRADGVTASGTVVAPSRSDENDGYRLVAVTDERPLEDGTIEYRPYGPHGSLALVVGFLFMLPTIFLSLGLSAVGYYYYTRTARGELPLLARDVVRADVTVDDRDGSSGDVTVTYTMDTFLGVDPERVGDLAWSNRLAVLNYLARWHDAIADGRVHRDVDDSIMGHLTAWANRDADGHVETVRSIQGTLERDAETRMEYADLLSKTLPDDAVADLESHREELPARLAEVLADVGTDLERA